MQGQQWLPQQTGANTATVTREQGIRHCVVELGWSDVCECVCVPLHLDWKREKHWRWNNEKGRYRTERCKLMGVFTRHAHQPDSWKPGHRCVYYYACEIWRGASKITFFFMRILFTGAKRGHLNRSEHLCVFNKTEHQHITAHAQKRMMLRMRSGWAPAGQCGCS